MVSPEPKKAQKPHFCARAAGKVASGIVKVAFVLITAHANMPQKCVDGR